MCAWFWVYHFSSLGLGQVVHAEQVEHVEHVEQMGQGAVTGKWRGLLMDDKVIYYNFFVDREASGLWARDRATGYRAEALAFEPERHALPAWSAQAGHPCLGSGTTQAWVVRLRGP